MGYLFQDVSQLADFLIQGSKNQELAEPRSSSLTTYVSEFEPIFRYYVDEGKVKDSFLDILATSNVFEQMDLPTPDREEVETAQPAKLNIRTVIHLLKEFNDKVTLEISSADATDLLGEDPKLGKDGPNENISRGKVFDFDATYFIQDSPTGMAIRRITFDPARLVIPDLSNDSDTIPVFLDDLNSPGGPRSVDVSKLMNLVVRYPDPIIIEISLPPQEKAADLLESLLVDLKDHRKSSFKFDLRQLLVSSKPEGDRAIEGVLVSSGKRPVSFGFDEKAPDKIPSEFIGDRKINVHKSVPIISVGKRSPDMVFDYKEIIRNEAQRPAYLDISQVKERLMDLRVSAKERSQVKAETDPTFGDDRYKKVEPDKPGRVDNGKSASIIYPRNAISHDINNRVSGILARNRVTANTDKKSISMSDHRMPLSRRSLSSNGVAPYPDQNEGQRIISELQAMDGSPRIRLTEDGIRAVVDSPIDNAANIEEIKSRIIAASNRGLTTIRIKLHPKRLGNLEIKLSWKGELLSANIKVENKEAAKILNVGLSELKSSLEAADLKTESIRLLIDDEKDYIGSGGESQERPATTGRRGKGNNHNRISSPLSGDEENPKINTNVSSVSNHRGWVDLKA